jgi:AcrR family transcriptional regulator
VKLKASRQQRRSKETRRKLIDAARTVFAERGLDSTRIDEITERADVGKGTFYYHFGSKEKLVREVIGSVVEGLTQAVAQRCAGAGDLRELLDSLRSAQIEFFANRWQDFVLYFQGRTDLTLETSYPGIETPFFAYLECVERLVASVMATQLSAPVLRRIACAVAGFVSGYYSFAAVASSDEDVDATFRSLRGAMVASLARFIQEAVPHADGAEPRSPGP